MLSMERFSPFSFHFLYNATITSFIQSRQGDNWEWSESYQVLKTVLRALGERWSLAGMSSFGKRFFCRTGWADFRVEEYSKMVEAREVITHGF